MDNFFEWKSSKKWGKQEERKYGGDEVRGVCVRRVYVWGGKKGAVLTCSNFWPTVSVSVYWAFLPIFIRLGQDLPSILCSGKEEKIWRECEENVKKMWRKCKKNKERTWRKYGENERRMWRGIIRFGRVYNRFFSKTELWVILEGFENSVINENTEN